MSKRVLLLLLSLLFITNVYADSKSVTLKYTEKTNVSTFSGKVSNNTASIVLKGSQINFKVNNATDSSVNVIKVSDEAYNWMYSIDNAKSYFYVESSGKITSISSDDKKIVVYNTSGEKLNSYSENVLYFSIQEKPVIKNVKVTLNIEGNGKVIINGNVFTESTDLEVVNNSVIIVVSDPNNVFRKFLINSDDITNKFVNNQTDYDLKDNDVLSVVFEEIPENAESNDTYDISGYIYKNGLPIQNAKLILHSEERITYTDSRGYYEFEDVPIGEHELLVLADEDTAIGYTKFVIEKALISKTSTKTNSKNVTTIFLNSEAEKVNMDLSVADNYGLNITKVNDNLEIEEKTSFNPIILLLLIPVIVVIIIFLKRKKVKTSN